MDANTNVQGTGHCDRLARGECPLAHLILVDDLTGLYNRRGFFALADRQLKVAGRAKRCLILLFADFDGLKRINDIFGHPVGDRALIEVAEVLKETFRESDILARIGGDEFVVLVEGADEASIRVFFTRLRENLETHNAGEGRRYKLALSVGLALYDPKRPCSVEELIAQADRLMYEQKAGANQSASS